MAKRVTCYYCGEIIYQSPGRGRPSGRAKVDGDWRDYHHECRPMSDRFYKDTTLRAGDTVWRDDDGTLFTWRLKVE